MTGRQAAILGLAILTCACAARPQLQTPANRTLVPSDVVRDAQALAGQEVSVTGYLAYGSHARQLSDSLREDAFDDCLTLINTRPRHRYLQRNSGRRITLRGVVRLNVTEGRLDYGACGSTGLQLLSPVQG